jgi:hypothetical protein
MAQRLIIVRTKTNSLARLAFVASGHELNREPPRPCSVVGARLLEPHREIMGANSAAIRPEE